MLENIINKVKSYNPYTDAKKIEKACEFVGDNRHAFGVVKAILPLRPDDDAIVSAFLAFKHQKKPFDLKLIRREFGLDVANILDNIKKLSAINYRENDRSFQLEVLRKMFLSMAKDVRVVLVKLACCLYIMQNLALFFKDDKKKLFAWEVFDVYVPLASRLGIYRMKVQLEDLAFKTLQPDQYKAVVKDLEAFGKRRRISIETIRAKLDRFLKERGYLAEVQGRLKSCYSIHRKLERKNLNSIDDLYDVFAMRIILPSEFNADGSEALDHLYSVLGMMHSQWKPLSRRFKDYIAVPKPNGYRSLHTVVLGLSPKNLDKPVEVQVRTQKMHREAEYGMASHWVYKQYPAAKMENLEHQIEWIKGLERVHESIGRDSEVISEVELDVFEDRIFVLTPRGEIKDLPVGSIPLDFAYSVHTQIGHQCVMAKVNGEVVSLDSELKNGDVVEILTRKDSEPKLQWLSIVKTQSAKNKIKQWFSKLNKENHIKEGKLLINKQLERLGKASLDPNYSLLKNFGGKTLNVAQRESIVEEVGKGDKLASDIVRKLFSYEELLVKKSLNTKKKRDVDFIANKDFSSSELENQILLGGEAGLPVKLSSCCKPKYGNSIVGYVTRGKRISIHRSDCKLLAGLDERRLIKANWKNIPEQRDKGSFRVAIKVKALPRIGLVRDVSGVISSMNVSIYDMRLNPDGLKYHTSHFVLDLRDLNQFDMLMDKIENIDGVEQVTREDDDR